MSAICSKCGLSHRRVGQRHCAACHAEAMRAHRRRVKRAASDEYQIRDFVSYETIDLDEVKQIAIAVASLEDAE